MPPNGVARRKPRFNARRSHARSLTLKSQSISPDLEVFIAHEGYSCRVETRGIDNSSWLLQCLSRSFAFKTSAPLQANGPSEVCTFRLAYGSQFTDKSLERLLLSIPGVRLRIHSD
jgi:hypothetical protein